MAVSHPRDRHDTGGETNDPRSPPGWRTLASLLQGSRRGQPQIAAVGVCAELEQTLVLMQAHLRNHRMTVVRQFEATVSPLQADRQQVRQVFLNLLRNASDAMPQGGTLTLGIAESLLELEVPAVVLTFTDIGSGIAPEDLPRVLGPFVITKADGKGTGLGLAMCRRIVQEHQGTLTLTSTLGVGPTVHIVLPISPATHRASVQGALDDSYAPIFSCRYRVNT